MRKKILNNEFTFNWVVIVLSIDKRINTKLIVNFLKISTLIKIHSQYYHIVQFLFVRKKCVNIFKSVFYVIDLKGLLRLNMQCRLHFKCQRCLSSLCRDNITIWRENFLITIDSIMMTLLSILLGITQKMFLYRMPTFPNLKK